MTNEEAFKIVSELIKTCSENSYELRQEAFDEPSERDYYMRCSEKWNERAEALGIVLGYASTPMHQKN